MTAHPASDPFAVLGIAPAYAVDLGAIERTHRELSRALHPDRYVNAPPSERRAALERAVAVNEAYRVVRDPISRAEALLALAGVVLGEDREPQADPAFLMEMLETREALAEAKAKRNGSALAEMAEDAKRRAQQLEDELAHGFASRQAAALVGKLGELRFVRRLLGEIRLVDEDSAP